MEFPELISNFGEQTESGRASWTEVDPDTYRFEPSSGEAVVVTGAYQPGVGFTGSVAVFDATDVEKARLDVNPAHDNVRQVQWLHSNARKASVDLEALLATFITELEA